VALSLTSTIKDKVAYRLYSTTYANAPAAGQALIDGAGASSLIVLEELAQWFNLGASTGNAPDVWEPWFVEDIVERLSDHKDPERAAIRQRKLDRAKRDALLAYTSTALTSSPSSSAAFVQNTLNVRKYVVGACLRRSPPLMVDVLAIDSALLEVLTKAWNHRRDTFRLRPAQMTLTRTALTGGTYDSSAKTITFSGGVGTGLPVGTRWYTTGGTGIDDHEGGEAIISTTSSTVITLLHDIGVTNGSTDVAGFYVVVTFSGLQSGETVDQIASKNLRYIDGGTETDPLMWETADRFIDLRTYYGRTTGRPVGLRVHDIGDVHAYQFIPWPDDDYTLWCEVLTRQAANPTSTTDTLPFTAFCTEYMPAIRRRVLAQVLTNHGRHDEALTAEVEDEWNRLFPDYQSPGEVSGARQRQDVYGDALDVLPMDGGLL
jgi:hypothetical protein